MISACLEQELPEPLYQIWADGTIVIVFRKKSSIQDGQTGGQTALKSDVNTVNVIANDTVNDTVKPDDVTVNDRLIESIRKNPGKNADFHARQFGRTRRTVMRYLSKLSGLVEFRGAPKTGGYYCKDEPLA